MLASRTAFASVQRDIEKHKTTAASLNRANEELMQRFFPDFLNRREAMADKFHNGYVQHNVTDYMNKSSEEQREFSLMMSDKMIGLDELYKTSDGKEYLDKFLKSRGIDLSKKPADMNLSDFLGQELEKGNIKADLTEVILDASNGAYERVDTPQAKKLSAFLSSNMENKKLQPSPNLSNVHSQQDAIEENQRNTQQYQM
ncbi:hypothetical protein [Neisseria bacilliformis]|uniref:hypothetical protein n=1 Tax=Neisseria bacilliformis TaxID=267212 RepID=UPI0028E6E804|nr:hypothetical protein [Neisseria bacilliformis]